MEKGYYHLSLYNGGTKPPECGAGFAILQKGVTRVTVGFSELLGSLDNIPLYIYSKPQFNYTEKEINAM